MVDDELAKIRQRRLAQLQASQGQGAAKEKEAEILTLEARGRLVTLFLFSTAMLILPLGTYFAIRHYIVDSTTFAAMGAVVMVQLILAVYIYKAWQDENRDNGVHHTKKQK